MTDGVAGGCAGQTQQSAQGLPTDSSGQGAQYWVRKPTYHNSFWYSSCMVTFKTSYGVIQQSLFYSTVYSEPDVDCPSTNLQRANDLVPYYRF